ncbi:histone H2B [Kipferlia bialata]|uniref:Histone H2B n=1 Tax=Kipferlia bialata TaxID=797122 RepID=A0A9K3CPH0_9EUKA|nr:histone H2B [Kipferlia bialata]|eukprot:g604.t1
MSASSMATMNSFINDIFDKLLTEATFLAKINNKTTVSHREINSAAHLHLPGDLFYHADAYCKKAHEKFDGSQGHLDQ